MLGARGWWSGVADGPCSSVTARILDDLLGMFRDGLLTRVEWREEVAEVQSRVLAAQSPRVHVMSSEKVLSLNPVVGKEESTSGVGAGVTVLSSIDAPLSESSPSREAAVPLSEDASMSTCVVSVSVGASASESLLVLAEEKSSEVAQQEIWLEDIGSW